MAVQRLHQSPEPASPAALSETLRAIRFRPDLPRRPGDPSGRRDREGPAGVAKTGFCRNRRSPGAVDDPALHGRGNGKPGHAVLPERAPPGVVFPKARGADGGGGRAIRGADELPGRPLGSQRRHAPAACRTGIHRGLLGDAQNRLAAPSAVWPAVREVPIIARPRRVPTGPPRRTSADPAARAWSRFP